MTEEQVLKWQARRDEAKQIEDPVAREKALDIVYDLRDDMQLDCQRKMADRICAVLAYPALGRLMVRNCANELKNIRWENAAAKLERIYGALAARGN